MPTVIRAVSGVTSFVFGVPGVVFGMIRPMFGVLGFALEATQSATGARWYL